MRVWHEGAAGYVCAAGGGTARLFAVGAAMRSRWSFVFSLAMLMYLFSVSCITHFMDVARSRHPKSMVLASSVEPMGI